MKVIPLKKISWPTSTHGKFGTSASVRKIPLYSSRITTKVVNRLTAVTTIDPVTPRRIPAKTIRKANAAE